MKSTALLLLSLLHARAKTALFLVVVLLCLSCKQELIPSTTSQIGTSKDGKGAFVSKKYRNLFKENGHSEAEIEGKINRAFQQLFHGDSASQAIYLSAGKDDDGPLSYIYDIYNKDVRSEGMSYGMMISLQMGNKAEFDALWNYAMTHMYLRQPGHPSEGYFAWSV